MRARRLGVILLLLATTATCGGEDEAAPVTDPTTTASSTIADSTTAPPTTTDSPTSPTTAPPTTTSPVTTAPVTTAPVTTTLPTASTTTTTTTSPANPANPVDVKVYLLRDERLAIAHRDVSGPAVLRGALTELLDGPTDDDAASGLHSEVPAATELLGVNLAGGIATVDLSADFASGGGTLSMTARLGQVIFTATQFDNVDAVLFWLEGEPVMFFGGEGILLGEIQTRNDVDRSFTGGVLIDRPEPGSTVRSPLTVTGEGDVFEGDFPIEVWSGGERVSVTVVAAGAWGDWAEFETTITIDAPPGPIELVADDGGGCGTDPECPPNITTVVPLTLVR